MALTDSLLAYWTLDEASGNRVDQVAALTLADNNTVTSTTGVLSSAAQFTRANSEYLSLADTAAVKLGNQNKTWACWVKIDSFPSGGSTIVGKDSDTGREYTIDQNGRFRFTAFGLGIPSVVADTFGDLSTGVWYFVVCWHDADNDVIGISVNAGTADTQSSFGAAPNDSTTDFLVGARRYPSFEGYFDGAVDELGIWSRVLTSGERTQLYNAGAGLAYPFGGGATVKPWWQYASQSVIGGPG